MSDQYSRGYFHRGWTINRFITLKEREILALIAKSAGLSVSASMFRPNEHIVGLRKFRTRGVVRFTITHIYTPDKSIPKISYEEAIEYLKKKVENRII